MNNPLNDKKFLKELDLVQNKKIFVKIQNLNFQEQVREEIEGKITNGSINIDGNSSVRRTCSLTMVTNNLNINDYLWVLNTKIKVFIGVENTINTKYDNIIWFKQGIFILTGCNISRNVNNCTISLTAQDKMCLLNGTVAGTLPGSIDFRQEAFEKTTYTEKKFGEQYLIGTYYTAKEYSWRVCGDESFSDTENYFIKMYEDYSPILVEENEYTPGKYYIRNKNLFAKFEESDWDNVNNRPKYWDSVKNKPLITFYKKKENNNKNYFLTSDENNFILSDGNIFKVQNEEDYIVEDIYEPYDITNNEEITKEKFLTLYKQNHFIKNTSNIFNEFKSYYIYNENGMFQQILLDKEKFEEDPTKYYIENTFIKEDNTALYDEFQQYYIYNEGYYEHTFIKSEDYLPNIFMLKEVHSYELSNEEFNEKEIYYEYINDNYIIKDFLPEETSEYMAGVYYIYQQSTGEYVLAMDKYNPSLIYYEKDFFKDLNDLPIKTIIKESVHTYGQEPYHNIIINDLDDYGLLLKEYRGDTPAYLLINNGICENFITDENQECYLINNEIDEEELNLYQSIYQDELVILKNKYKIGEINEEKYKEGITNIFNSFNEITKSKKTIISNQNDIIYDTFIDSFNINPSHLYFYNENSLDLKTYTIMRLEYGDAAGYEQKDLTYPEDLISSVGDTLTSVLDKIIDKISGFEYFYDIDGRFIFQKKKTYLNTTWNTIVDNVESDEIYVENAAYASETQYTFEDNRLITSISNAPKLDNFKNDYCVWGVRKSINGNDIPIHARYAIDKKPYAYVTFPLTKFNYQKNIDEVQEMKVGEVSYLKQNIYVNKEEQDFIILNDFYNAETDERETFDGLNLYKTRIEPIIYNEKTYGGIYYQIYICDWREIIYQMAVDYYKHNQENDFSANISEFNTFNYQDYSSEGNEFLKILEQNNGKLYPNGTTGYEQYYVDIYSFWRELYNPDPEIELGYSGGYYNKNKNWVNVVKDYSDFNCDYFLPESKYNYYKKELEYIIEQYENEIDKIEKQLSKYKTNDIYPELEELQKQLNEYQKEKEKLLKTIYSQKLVAVNDPEYLELQKWYQLAVDDKNNALKELEERVITTLQEEFGLY